MDLKKRKYIKNGNLGIKDLPGYEKGFEQLGGALTSALNTAGTINSLSYPTMYANDYFGSYGQQSNQINGVNYTTLKPIDTQKEEDVLGKQRDTAIMQSGMMGATTGMGLGLGTAAMLGSGATIAGASAGTILGPAGMILGAGLGALFGGIAGNRAKKEQEHQMAIAQQKQQNFNDSSRSDALTTYLQQEQAKQYGNTASQNLYSVKNGSEGVNPITMQTYNKFNVQGSHGKESNYQNAWLDNNEWVEGVDGSAYKVNGKSNKKDSVRGRLNPGDRVASNTIKIPGTNKSIADMYPIAKSEGWENELFGLQRQIKETKEMKHNKSKLAKAAYGIENFMATIPGLIQSWADYRNIANDSSAQTNIVPVNKYENYAGQLMANRHANIYPVMQQITENDAANRYSINASPGLSVAQKTLANLANSYNTRQSIANAIMKGQELDNQYRADEAQMMARLGESSMNAKLNADQFNTQMRAKTHNARIQGMNMAKRNALDYLTQFFKNKWERNQFDKMYELYAQDVANRTPKPTNNESNTSTPDNGRHIGYIGPSYALAPGQEYFGMTAPEMYTIRQQANKQVKQNNWKVSDFYKQQQNLPYVGPIYQGGIPVFSTPTIQDMIYNYGRIRK